MIRPCINQKQEMGTKLVHRIRRGMRKPPRIIARRIFDEFNRLSDRFLAPRRARRWDGERLIAALGARDIDDLWGRLAARPYPAYARSLGIAEYDGLTGGDSERVLAAAGHALERRLDLLGSGEFRLEAGVWDTDYKTGFRWPNAYCRAIEYNNAELPSDVKVPWEISRLQWLIPAGQAYLLTGDASYAEGVRDILSEWIDANPYAWSVNWACTMEVALRIVVWTWFFHVFKESQAWRQRDFRERFLSVLYLHGDFTARHLEFSDVNGNHYTANAVGLVFAGLFFGNGSDPQQWTETGWRILQEEFPRQVYADGVDFEASVAYHRLVAELFLASALYRQAVGLEVAPKYWQRLNAMARFAEAYTRLDGSAPLLGDADDGRVLPFGGQDINDHRSLVTLIAMASGEQGFESRGSRSAETEAIWWFGPTKAAVGVHQQLAAPLESAAFPDGGIYVLRTENDHVFIDCGPVGLAGRGGHGHNDCLSFEAMLAGVRLVTDCGAYLYTASYEWRNRFRSTAYHNTPCIDGEEQNRFIRPDYLWNLHNNAEPEVRRWETGKARGVFVGAHAGYRRLMQPVVPERSIVLEHEFHRLLVHDRFEGDGEHSVSIPWHMARQIDVERLEGRFLRVKADGRDFLLAWQGDAAWELNIGEGWLSPSYGVKHPIVRLEFVRTGKLSPLTVALMPEQNVPADIGDWMQSMLCQIGVQ